MKNKLMEIVDRGLSEAYRMDVKGDDLINEGKHWKKTSREMRRALTKIKAELGENKA